MQIGIRAHDMERVPIEKLIENISAKGFKCTQLALSKAIYSVSTDTASMTPGFAMYLRNIFRQNNVDVAVLGCYLNLADPDREQLKKTKDIYKAHIRFAALLGCGMVGTETGAVNSTYSFEPANRSDEALDIFIDNLRDIVDYAEKMGVIIGIEPVANHIVYDIKRARKVLDAIDSPNLQIIFDPVNIITKDNYMKQDEMITEAFDILREEIACIHLKDFIVDYDGNIKSVISGDGLLNYDLLMLLIRKNKPYIHMLLEDTKPDNVLYAKEYVEDKYYNIKNHLQ